MNKIKTSEVITISLKGMFHQDIRDGDIVILRFQEEFFYVDFQATVLRLFPDFTYLLTVCWESAQLTVPAKGKTNGFLFDSKKKKIAIGSNIQILHEARG